MSMDALQITARGSGAVLEWWGRIGLHRGCTLYVVAVRDAATPERQLPSKLVLRSAGERNDPTCSVISGWSFCNSIFEINDE